MKHTPTSLVDILRWRATDQPQAMVYRFLNDGEYDEVTITLEALDRRARAIAAILQASTKAGDRALLLFPAGLDFIAAYFGCLYAKVIAIPVYPPHPARMEKTLENTQRIIVDAEPVVALTTLSLFRAIKSQYTADILFANIKLLVTDNDEIDDWAEKWLESSIAEADTAFLQYTSGSTTSPKGVMVSHGNLLHNLRLIEHSMGLTNRSHTVFWLPFYHDMGLIGGILQPVYTGFSATLIPHLAFLQRPIRWLQAITRFRATASGGPNFAYDLCLRKVRPEQREQLDLRSWDVAFNGAEPIYHKTLDQFAEYFAPCGFRKEALLPCYGLAEATLMVVGGPKTRPPVMQKLIKSSLEKNEIVIAPGEDKDIQTVVSSGQNPSQQQIKIVDPGTLNPCIPGKVGEIWVSGPSVAAGYWNKPVETLSTFGAHLSNSGEGPFMRTGDLGFMQEGELYITGRLKNLIIIDGKNHYPHDIEKTVEAAYPAIRPGGSAVFSIEYSGNERVIVLVEIQHKLVADPTEITKAIRRAVSEQHDLSVFDIKLTLPGSIPKTTSGKKRHFLCRKNYLDGTFREIKFI